jgi:hypothetical protein
MSRRFRSRMTGGGIQLKRGFCAGAGPNVNMTLTGIKPGDEIVSVLEVQGTTSSSGDTIAADRTAVARIVSQNTIRLVDQTSAGRQLEVLWWSK